MARALSLALPAFWFALLPTPTSAAPAKPPAAPALVLGINPYLDAPELMRRFQPLADLIAARLGRPVEVRVARSNQEHIKAVAEDRIDIAYVGAGNRARLISTFGARYPLLVRQQASADGLQHSYLVVRRDSPYATPADLKGHIIGYSDRDSSTGYVLCAQLLRLAGVPPAALREQRFLATQTNVALAVLAGDVDGGSLKDELLDEYGRRGLRVLAELPPVPDFGIVVSHQLPSADAAALRDLFVHLKDSDSGRAAMHSIRHDLTSFMLPRPDEDALLQPIIAAQKGEDRP